MINLRKLFANFNILRLTVDHYYFLPPLVVLKGYCRNQAIGLKWLISFTKDELFRITWVWVWFLVKQFLAKLSLQTPDYQDPFLLRTGGLTQKSGIAESKLDRVKYGGS